MPKTKVVMKSVEVTIPIVKLRVQDLSYLRGLLTEGPKCSVPYTNLDRLRVLGLIEDKKLPACPKEMRKYNKSMAQADRLAIRAIKGTKVNWTLLGKAANLRPNKWNLPKEREITAVTAAGKKLISKGTAQVQIQKGCR